ncbi:MAG: MFS transporter [Bacillota bacterium]|nr:MFS transporter [Bacillota bacterium]
MKKSLIIVLVVAIGTFMSSLDTSAVNLVMPMIKNDFKISISTVEWIVTAYLLIISSLLLTFGRMSDLYGHKRIYLTGFIIFTAGSFLCGLSANIAMLIAFRIIQAIGAGMLFSTGPAIITNAVSPSNRGKALSVSAIAVALGICIGPVIGGVIATVLGWQSIFFINVPIGLLGIILVIIKIPHDGKANPVPFDITGSLMVFSALLLIMLPLNISGDHKISSALFISLIAAGLLLVVIFVLYEKKCRYPMLNVNLFKNRLFTAGNAAALLTYMAEFIMVFLAPFYLENLRQFSAIKAGMLYLPMPLATMLIAPLSGMISDRFDSRFISSAGTFIMAGGLLIMSFFTKDTSLAYIIISMIIVGLGFGMFQTPNNSAIMGSVPHQNRGIASGALATMRNVGMVIGIAISGAVFSASQNKALTSCASQGISDAVIKDRAFTHGLHVTFVAAIIVALIAMIASLVKGNTRTESEEK